ncbi:cytochrome P450 [Hypoxylon trugodes]|uniref:cytochrome P450 n=1 Tax=Hypoxylon trugodes TaxID=326681 RepID=UPI00219B48EA|nr:cytochrome P450 [Hypoxylon trugodes]KAI1384223.1 cytochrome P450 [Hypoxylon trugodes]
MAIASEIFETHEFHYVLLGIIIGLIAHHRVFIYGEWHIYAPQIIVSHGVTIISLLVARLWLGRSNTGLAAGTMLTVFYCYLCSLTTSIIVYRVFFHQLTRAGFAGPWYARISTIWHVWAARKAKNHLILEKLYREYGDFIRTGPAEITVFHPDVFIAIDGPRTECIKSEFYDFLYPSTALAAIRDRKLHTTRRQQWNHGLTPAALTEHNKKILGHIDMLVKIIEADAVSGSPTRMDEVLYWFSWDAMGDFVFSKPFGMLEKRQWHQLISGLRKGLFALGPLASAPWMIQCGFRLAPRVGALKDWDNMMAWCTDLMKRSLDTDYTKDAPKDLSYYILERDNTTGGDPMAWVYGDSLQSIAAGSEPMAGTLLCLFLHLARHPRYAEKVYDELIGIDVTDRGALSQLIYLNAVINETMRLSPTLLTGGARKSGENGVTIGGTYIPPHTTIIAPRWIISRREDCFEQAKEFIPERWGIRSDMRHNPAASTPFATGRNSCVGRQLSLDTMRCVVAKLVKKYKVRFAPGETGDRVYEDMIDHFTTTYGTLALCFELRE